MHPFSFVLETHRRAALRWYIESLGSHHERLRLAVSGTESRSHRRESVMCRRPSSGVWAVLFVAILVLAPATVAGGDSSVKGSFWCGTDEGAPLEVVLLDGIAYPDELQGGERVKVILLPEGADRERVLGVLSRGEMMIHARLDAWVTFDVCRYEDGENEICGVHFSCGDTSSSRSGFGVFGHFTKSVLFEDENVTASLVTEEDEDSGSDRPYGFDLSFDLPITRFTGD